MSGPGEHAPWAGAVAAASAALAALPGIGALVSGLAVPNDLAVVFGGFYASVGTIVVMLIWARRDRLSTRSSRWHTSVVVGAAASAIVIFAVYQWLYRTSTITMIDARGAEPIELEVRFPVFGAPSLRQLVQEYGGGSRYDAIVAYSPERMAGRLQEADVIVWLAVSDLLLLLAYLLVALPLAFALAVAGVVATSAPGSSQDRRSEAG